MTEQELALKLWIVLSRARNAVADHVEDQVTANGVTHGEFAVMEALYHKGPLLLGEVQRKILVSSGGVTYLVDRLEKKGFVERQACPNDRRARYAVLTEAGKAWMEKVFPEHARRLTRVLGGLSRDDKVRAIELLRTLGMYAATQSGVAGSADAPEVGAAAEAGAPTT